MEGALDVLGKSFKTVLDEVDLYSYLIWTLTQIPQVTQANPSSPQINQVLPPRQKTFKTLPFLDTSTTVLVCIFSSILSHSSAN